MTTAPPTTPPTTPPPIAKDPSSLSNPTEAILTHLNWEALVDFATNSFFAKATYDVRLLQPAVKVLTLDTAGLDIVSVHVDAGTTDNTNNDSSDENVVPVSFSMHTTDPSKKHLGSPLQISLPPATTTTANKTDTATIRVIIQYRTTDECTAAQWLPPAQTAGKNHPYVFTQCQAIHARSLLPCMDCPSVKMTYEASVTVPSWATCVMSALSKDESNNNNNNDPKEQLTQTRTYHFHQPIPIPSYLFALAVGNLSSRDISPRCRVWSEPSMVDAVAYEFDQVEDFLKAAEGLTCEYQWGRYDLLCLPPSFPYGGMENPCLTFVTPTLLAGDRSLADVVAHEAAHSWSGNLVTNATWEHFWLNEGWTIFLQRKIMSKIHDNNKFFDFDAIGGWESLKDDVKLMPEKYTKLIPDLGDDDPDDAFSSVPYEKGFNLLYSLEKIVGEEAFSKFIKAYFNHFKFVTVTSQQFREFFEYHFKDVDGATSFDWDTWLYKPGLPETPDFDRTLSSECEGLADAWLACDEQKSQAPAKDISAWSTAQKTCFLDAILSKCETRNKPLPVPTVKLMQNAYNMNESQNSEILFRFCMISIEAGDETIVPIVLRFITTQGRMKFVRPLYRALFKSDVGKEIAVKTFLENRDFYHPIAAKMVATDLCVGEAKDEKEIADDNDVAAICKIKKFLLIGSVVAVAALAGMTVVRGRRK